MVIETISDGEEAVLEFFLLYLCKYVGKFSMSSTKIYQIRSLLHRIENNRFLTDLQLFQNLRDVLKCFKDKNENILCSTKNTYIKQTSIFAI